MNYISASTNRVFPMRFHDQKRSIELEARHVVGVNESNAHFAAGLAGLGVIQTFTFIAEPAGARGELVPILTRFQPRPYVPTSSIHRTGTRAIVSVPSSTG